MNRSLRSDRHSTFSIQYSSYWKYPTTLTPQRANILRLQGNPRSRVSAGGRECSLVHLVTKVETEI